MQTWVGVAFLAGTVAWTGVLAWVARGANRELGYDRVSGVVSIIRRYGTVAVLVVLGVAFLISLGFLPYAAARVERLGSPQVTVDVEGSMWRWALSQERVPVGRTVEFRVTSRDVNHGFGIYAPDGRLVAQVQAMPGYTNRLIVRFDRPGTYTIRCLEFCATGHHVMVGQLTVE